MAQPSSPPEGLRPHRGTVRANLWAHRYQGAALITHVETVAVYVADQDRALRFYVDQLGFELRKDVTMGPDDGAPRWIEVAPPGG